MFNLHQVQIETKTDIYSFEIGTNSFNAVDIALLFLANERGILIHRSLVHVGGYDVIGTTKQAGVNSFSINGQEQL